ncbi:sulfatase-like hydrolase/transferase [Luteolibacter arcticus]|uniref:Sulfatase-like hydrolase/transferase n=1 Tax=Luteolibacter arcticus TaxID=1581411 RepID=A0ABT3GJ46_9BACT|nr:sulfatase-like hydrolase/transferase [Luteolibacter arcticus]MCW1923545.1 sulfatase-like hydrolase/transferase [Luteolibacter arcticus]
MNRSFLRILSIVALLMPTGRLAAAPGDADNDGLRDAVETNTGVFASPSNTGTSPSISDTDGDSLPDGMELGLGTNPVDATSKVKRPNIIYILADDMGYGDVGCFWQNQRSGIWKFATPGLDAMAADGAKLTHHYVGAPICVSSRCSLLQGQHQGHAGIRDAQFDYALPSNHSISSTLQAAGYRTVHIGKAGLVGKFTKPLTNAVAQGLPAHPLKRGFDRYFGYLTHEDGHEHYPRNGTTLYKANICDDYQPITDAYPDLYSTDAWTAFAKKTIVEETQQHPERPFFIYLSYDAPHFYGQYAPTANYPTGKGLTGGLQWTGSPSYANTATGDASKVDNPANFHPSVNSSWPLAAKKYVSMVRRLDDSVADLLQTLRDLGIHDNTLVVFSSDNGPADTEVYPPTFQSYGPFEGIKGDLWEGGIRVPTIAWWPETIPGTTQLSNIREVTRPSANWDWLATFSQLAQVPAPSFTDGVSLIPALTNQGTQADRGYLYFEFVRGFNTPPYPDFVNHGGEAKWEMQAIRIGNFMGVRPKIESPSDSFKIYNVVTDPKQGINLAASRPDLQQQMQRLGLGARRKSQYFSRSYEIAAIPATPLVAVTSGLICKSFEGNWPWLPEFREMTPVSTTLTAGVSPAPRSRPDDVGLSFEGYLSVQTTGSYLFRTNSDAATCVWVDEARVIDNDYNFAAAKTSDPIVLTAGLHPIRIHYRHLGGTASLQLSYSGPGIAMQPIPNSAFFIEGQPPELHPDTLTTPRVTEATANVVANDSSTLPLTLLSAGPTPLGTTGIGSNLVHLTPGAGTIGYDEFPYVVSNGYSQHSSQVSATVLFDNEIWLPFEEGAGTSVNRVGGSPAVTGSLAGFADPASAWTAGRFHGGLSFDGIDDHVDFPGLALPTGQQPRTFSGWVKTVSRSSPELQTLFSYGSNITGGRFVVGLDNSPNVASDQPLRLDVNGGYITGTRPLNDGGWHHVAVVVANHNGSADVNVSETKLWVDGNLDPVSSSSGRVLATGATLVPCLGGSNHNDGYNFTGKLDDVRIFDRALSDAEVQALYLSRPIYLTAPVDSTGDDDGDGMSDDAEEISGTDPHDATSVLQIDEFNFSGGTAFLQWMAVPGRDYQVEESTNLQSWQSVPGQGPIRIEPPSSPGGPALPQTLSVYFATSGQGSRYFRLKVTLTNP